MYHESAQSIVFRDHLRRKHLHDAQKNHTATAPAKIRSSNSSVYSNGNKNGNGSGGGNYNGNRSSSKWNASVSDANSIATRTTFASKNTATKGANASPVLKNNNNSKDANAHAHAVSHAAVNANRPFDAKNTSFKDDVSIISNNSRVSHDISSYLGTTDHAIHADSNASIASSLDGTHEQHEQHKHHDIDNDHHSFSTINVDDQSTHSCSNPHTTSHPHYDSRPQVIIANYTPKIDPLPPLDLEPHNEFSELLLSNPYTYARDSCSSGQGPEEAVPNQHVWDSMSLVERNVAEMLLKQRCVIKTVKNSDLTSFIQKFPVLVDKGQKPKRWLHPVDFKVATKMERINKYREIDGSGDANGNGIDATFHSFFTSVSLLPPLGLKMRCYGSTREYTAGVVFALPNSNSKDGDIDTAAERSHSWAWPSGYAAKTEFNISARGELINGRKESLVSISRLRSNNHSYIYDTDYGAYIHTHVRLHVY